MTIRLEPRHAGDVEDLVDRERAVDSRQQERRARADRRVGELVERARELRLALEIAEEQLEDGHDRVAVAMDQLLGERGIRILGQRHVDGRDRLVELAGRRSTRSSARSAR